MDEGGQLMEQRHDQTMDTARDVKAQWFNKKPFTIIISSVKDNTELEQEIRFPILTRIGSCYMMSRNSGLASQLNQALERL